MTNEQIEQKMQQLKQLAEQMNQLKNELVEAGAWPLDDNELDQAAGGRPFDPENCGQVDYHRPHEDPQEDPFGGESPEDFKKKYSFLFN